MRIELKPRESGGINVGAFSDIAFLLIIFFILTTTLVRPVGRTMDIPSGTGEPSDNEQKQLTVTLSRDDIRMGDGSEPVTMDEFRRRLSVAALPARPEDQRTVLLECREDVPFDRYFKIVTAISRAGGILALLDETDE